MRLARAFILCCSLAVAAAPLACGPTASIRYDVSISEVEPREVRVTADVSGVPPDSLVLSGFAGPSVLRVTEVSATDPQGRPLSVRAAADSLSVGGRVVLVPRYVIAGPLPSKVRVRYRVAPGSREGDSHMGFTGVRHGYLGSRFALLTGRSLFLLPGRTARVGDIRVRFSLPAGWSAVTSWTREGEEWRPGIGGRFADEHLIASSVGLGSFSERAVEIGGTRYRFAFEKGIPPVAADSAAASLERASRELRGLFGRDLGREYVTVVAPAAPDGDEIRGEGWAQGQGGTFAPITAGRLHEFAASLLNAYLRDAPYRDEIARADEYWVLDGIANLYAWRAVASAGLVNEEDMERDLAASYWNARRVKGSDHDLERLYAPGRNNQLARETEAPFMLAAMDRQVREKSRGKETLDQIVRAMFRSRPAASIWASLPPGDRSEWAAFRARYVRGGEGVPSAQQFGFAPAESVPSPPAGEPVRQVSLIFTGDTFGFLEHCGCKVNQSGGVARRATVIDRLRRAHPSALLLDVGNAFFRPDKQADLDFLSREEQRLYLKTMALMRYDAAAIGMTELLFGAGWFRDATSGTAIPYVSANVAERGARLAPASRLVRAGRARVGVVSAFEPPHGAGTLPQFEANTVSLTISDPVASLESAISKLPGRPDLVIAIGRLRPATIRRLVAKCPEVDLVISNIPESPALVRGSDGGDGGSRDPQGFLGRTLVLYEDSQNYALESVELGIDAEGHIATAVTRHHWLYEDVPDQPRVRAMLNRFYDRVGTIDSAQASVKPLFAGSTRRMNAAYVGAARCAPCHAAEFDQWKTTRHAAAYKTLLDAHRHYQPKCVVCHVVGFRTRTGYKIGDPEEPLANVQCEICHGPGGAHVAFPARENIEKSPPESTCLECHNPEHSDAFVYAEKLPFVQHKGVLSSR